MCLHIHADRVIKYVFLCLFPSGSKGVRRKVSQRPAAMTPPTKEKPRPGPPTKMRPSQNPSPNPSPRPSPPPNWACVALSAPPPPAASTAAPGGWWRRRQVSPWPPCSVRAASIGALCRSREPRGREAGPKMAPTISLLFFLFFFGSIFPPRMKADFQRFARPRLSSNFYAILRYSMTNKVSFTKSCPTRAWWWCPRGWRFGEAFTLGLSVQNLTGTDELFSIRSRHSLYVVAPVSFNSQTPPSPSPSAASFILLELLPPVALLQIVFMLSTCLKWCLLTIICINLIIAKMSSFKASQIFQTLFGNPYSKPTERFCLSFVSQDAVFEPRRLIERSETRGGGGRSSVNANRRRSHLLRIY